ncbi:MAG: MFS transporter [Desulfobacterales bacterium]|nr:MFS transporter [Desulfobacterales bacterium]
MKNENHSETVFTSGAGIRQGSYLILTCFFFAHATFHFMSQSFSVMLPAVKTSFGISPIQLGAIMTAHELAAGLSSLPGGILSDYLRRHRALLMAACMVVFGLGWLLISVAPFYGFVLVGMIILAIAGSIWHLPSLAELGLQFSNHRGAALAIHGSGGSMGDIFGPVLTGLLLGFISWQSILSMYFIVPLIMAGWIYYTFFIIDKTKNKTPESHVEKKADFKEQLAITKDILKRTHLWRVNFVAGFRGMCFAVIVTFLPLFMKEQLGFSSKSIGFHFGLLWAIGIVASPLMGHLSDRWGRKQVLVPALLYSCLLITLMAFFGKGAIFTLLIVLLGFSIRSDYSLVSATILDIAGNRVATTILGVQSLTRYLMGAVSPLIAGALYQYSGMRATLLYVAVLFACAAFIFSTVDLGQKAEMS